VFAAYNAAHEDLPMAFEIPIPKDLKVRRGLGILEELIQEKNPDFFKIQNERRHAQGTPYGIPSKSIAEKLVASYP